MSPTEPVGPGSRTQATDRVAAEGPTVVLDRRGVQGRHDHDADPDATAVLPALPPAPPPGGTVVRRRRGPLRQVRRIAGALVLLLLVGLGWSVGTAIGRPTSDTTTAKVAEWAREHHLGGVVNYLEQKQYDLNKPKVGGTVANGFRVGTDNPTAAPAPTKTVPRKAVRPHTPAPAAIAPLGVAQSAQEGAWRTLVSVDGLPAIRGTAVTPDTEHTSYAVTVAWMDPKLLTLQLRPGASEPGGPWSIPSQLTVADRRTVAATFNSGFRLLTGDAHGGFEIAGRNAVPLRQGAASLVIDKDGTAKIGAWGRDVTMTPQVQSVRQNLAMLIDHGVIPGSVDEGSGPTWGFTLNSADAVWRSGAGVTRSGALVFAYGNALTTRTLANVLQRAGAVQAMELDINTQWQHFDYYAHAGGTTTAHALNPSQDHSPEFYYSLSARDFFAVFPRGVAAAR